ncbi:MAG: endolytic transglycosylase MltG, partial [Mycobacteriales bacterium]
MSDLLQHEPAEPSSHRAEPRVPRGVAVLIVVVVLALLGSGAVYGVGRVKAHFSSAPDYSGDGSGQVVAQVKPGETSADVARTLAALDIVKSAEAFRSTAANDPASISIQPGYYQLRLQMSAKAALALLLDPSARLRGRVTIPEGSTVEQTVALVAKNTEVPLAELKAAAAKPAALGLPTYAKNRLEG